ARRLDRRGKGAEDLGEAGAADPGERQNRRAVPRRAGQRAALLLDFRRGDRIGLVKADDLGFADEAVTVTGELVADRAVGADDILFGAVDQMQDYGAALDMAEKAGAETGSLAGAFDQTRQIGEHKFGVVVEAHDAELGMQRR